MAILIIFCFSVVFYLIVIDSLRGLFRSIKAIKARKHQELVERLSDSFAARSFVNQHESNINFLLKSFREIEAKLAANKKGKK
jgi:hypothetical protein